MKIIQIYVTWNCDKCGRILFKTMDHEPDEFKNEYPFELPVGWFENIKHMKHYCSEKCLNIAHPETKNTIWIA